MGAVSGEALVGRRIEIHWPLDEAWYEALVSAYDDATKRHEVRYVDDDVVEALDLQKEEWRLHGRLESAVTSAGPSGPSAVAPETASPSRAPAARGLRDPHPASAPRWPRDRCGNLRASTTTAHEQRREHAVHVTGVRHEARQVSSASFHPGPGTHQHIYSTVARGVWLGSRAGQRHTHHVTTAIHVQ